MSMTKEEHVRRETRPLLIEVHAAGVCIRRQPQTTEVLLAKRAKDRELFPGKIESCGGQVPPSLSFQDAVAYHFREEMGIEVHVVGSLCLPYTIQHKGLIIPGIRFLCLHKHGEPSSKNHEWVKWVPIDKLAFIPPSDFAGDMSASASALIGSWHALVNKLSREELSVALQPQTED